MATEGGTVHLIFFRCVLFLAAGATVTFGSSKPGCSDKCGNVSIPYPFGMTPSCYLNENFSINCNRSLIPPRPQLNNGNLVVTDITLEGQLEVLHFVAKDCYSPNGTLVYQNSPALWSDFTISNDKNKFTAVGCDTYAIARAERKDTGAVYMSGCISYCDKKDTMDFNNSCSGIGCCQISIPSGLHNFEIIVKSFDNHTYVWDFNPCGYGFLADETKFSFSNQSFDDLENIESLPLVLDWAIGNETCKVAERKPDYACKQNSICIDPENRPGYICKCKDGYYGNPYLPYGCLDIDECKNSSLHNCMSEKNCVNTLGNYTCSCSKGYHGEGRKDGTGCIHDEVNFLRISTATGLSLLVVIVGPSWFLFIHKRRKLFEMKKKFFRQNGGLLLQQELSERKVSTETVRIFTAEELKTATRNYNDSQIIGKGGFGTVYKGVLKKGRMVAIKKSKVVDQSQINQFINEVIILSQINHRNVVKLLGCCLETEIPLLVYEFVSNGTLSEHIHCKNKDSSISWEIRLRIATESAQVLSYLHSAASTPIIHRDVKPANILLDDNYTAKVSDFGASRLVPLDGTQLSTLVQGTLGYLDPEYLQTSQLNEKSDVYSFGVVLVELLTSKMALSFDGPEEERNLANYFLKSLRDGNLFQNLDDKVAKEGDREQIKEVAEVAKRCLRVKSEKRPTMKEVATELEGLRVKHQHPWAEVAVNQEETPIVSIYTSN